MTETVESFNGKKLWLTLVFASIFVALFVVSTNEAFATDQIIFLNDQFDTSISGWQYFGDPGYEVVLDTSIGMPASSARITGDAWHGICSKHGMYKVVDISSYYTGPLTLDLNWRASSNYAGSATTIAEISVNNPDNGAQLFSYRLVNGGTKDTGWQNYYKDISSYVSGVKRIQISLYLYDCWIVNWNENNWYDNISLIGGSVLPNQSAPTGLTATATSTSEIDLRWEAPSSLISLVTGYRIERSLDNGFTWNVIAENTGNGITTYSDTGLSPSTTYTYRVFAITGVVTSPPSNTASDTTKSIIINSNLTVDTQNLDGTAISGIYIELYQNDIQKDSGFSPVTFILNSNQTYTVAANNWIGYSFDHWFDTGSTNNFRDISILADTSIIAVYRTTP